MEKKYFAFIILLLSAVYSFGQCNDPDITPPVAVCQDMTVQLDATGNASITPTQIDNGSNDACGIASLTLDNDTFTCANIGANTVTLTVTDDSGLTDTCTATVIVQDNTPPTATNPANINVQCLGDVPAVDPAVVTTEADNCG